jgi:hypothetical protein
VLPGHAEIFIPAIQHPLTFDKWCNPHFLLQPSIIALFGANFLLTRGVSDGEG